MVRRFIITYDYLCPFARIANETLVEAIAEGAGWEPTFMPFSLHHNRLPDDARPVWDDAGGSVPGRGVLALLWSIAVRDSFPDHFAEFHLGLFSARHDDGADLSDPQVLERVALASGLDAGSIRSIVASGTPVQTLRDEHTELVEQHGVFGVPTFIAGGEAVFVRFMERHRHDDLRKVIDMLSWVNLNEFKRTRVPR